MMKSFCFFSTLFFFTKIFIYCKNTWVFSVFYYFMYFMITGQSAQ